MLVNYFRGHIKVLAVSGVILAVALSLFPMIYRTWVFGSDAWGLTVIALLDPEEMPWSPFDSNSSAIRPAAAYWLLMHSDWPYGRCGKAMSAMGGCSQPLINFVGASLDAHDADSIMRRRGYALLRHFAARGEPVNGYYRGLAAIHEAILFANIDYLHALLRLGADPELPIDAPERAFDGLNAFEFAAFLESRHPEVYRDVRRALEAW